MIHIHWFHINKMFSIFITDMKNKKHKKIIKDYDKQKSRHLEKIADRMLKDDGKMQILKSKNINTDFLNLF